VQVCAYGTKDHAGGSLCYCFLMDLTTRNSTDWAKCRVLVTGGAGFIGSFLASELNRLGCTDLLIADFPAEGEKKRNVAGLRFAEYLEPWDLLSRLQAGSIGKLDFIFHLGACSSTTESNEQYLRENNTDYTRTLAEWALNAGSRFVYASSAATYGDGSAGMDDKDPRQLARLKPLNLYGMSKHQFDLEAWRLGWLDRIVGLKYFNVFGPHENHKGDMRSVICKSYFQVQDTGVIPLFKSYRPEYRDGEQNRDFLYVKDAVYMTLFLATHAGVNGIFNVGSGRAHTWNELADAIFSAMGREPRIEYVEMPESIRDKYQYSTQADIGKLRSAGYDEPITSLDAAVRDYIVNYLMPAYPSAGATSTSS
jgi:ADP-L-glycero-D-manno-heptose 6-epimerase